MLAGALHINIHSWGQRHTSAMQSGHVAPVVATRQGQQQPCSRDSASEDMRVAASVTETVSWLCCSLELNELDAAALPAAAAASQSERQPHGRDQRWQVGRLSSCFCDTELSNGCVGNAEHMAQHCSRPCCG